MLDRLHALHKQACAEKRQDVPSSTNSPSINFARPFAHLAKDGKESSGNYPIFHVSIVIFISIVVIIEQTNSAHYNMMFQ